ncbi:MAG: HAMP domain-containing sensor histidine kinase [Bacteroidota bacterium]
MFVKSNRLYWKISATLLSLLVVLGVVYVLIGSSMQNEYFQEVNQSLYGGIAESTVNEVSPLIDGEVDTTAIKDIMHSMMVINPSVEVYLLDTAGKIITYVAPYKKVKLEKVDLKPIKTFIEAEEKPFISGDDPRHPGTCKVFSAAPLLDGERLAGYVYIILASEEQTAVTSTLFGSYIFRLGSRYFFIALAGALLIGLVALWFLTQNLRSIVDTVRRFKEGDYEARIAQKTGQGELSVLSSTFNDMADTIVGNIDKLKAVEKLRQELIANVSHDLRTPLAIMQGYIETLLLKEGDISTDERRKYLEIVLSSSERLSKLIAQLFEYSKLEARQIEPQKEPFFLSELVQDISQKYQILAREKGIEIRLDVAPKLPMVFADLGLVERVIQNLVDNALKFTPEGGKVTLELQSNDQEVEVRIADTGPGIPEDQQAVIFERYRQAAPEAKKKGVGLGLTIAQKILELHNARIEVKSRLDEGTVFFFQLPAYAG